MGRGDGRHDDGESHSVIMYPVVFVIYFSCSCSFAAASVFLFLFSDKRIHTQVV